MKFFYCILISFFSYNAISQQNSISIKGIVSCDTDSEKVENALVHLKLSNGGMFEHKTNSFGEYEFIVKTDTALLFSISIGTDKSTKSKSSLKCGFLASADFFNGKLELGNNYIKNFKLNRITCCGMSFPKLIFYQNSISSCNDSLIKKDSTQFYSLDNSIHFLYELLQDNPTIVIEMGGHTSSIEKNKKLLSFYRAELIKEMLVVKGINRQRIKIKGWGSEKQLISKNQIKKAKTKEEKLALHLKNQRVVFRIISWEFVEDEK